MCACRSKCAGKGIFPRQVSYVGHLSYTICSLSVTAAVFSTNQTLPHCLPPFAFALSVRKVALQQWGMSAACRCAAAARCLTAHGQPVAVRLRNVARQQLATRMATLSVQLWRALHAGASRLKSRSMCRRLHVHLHGVGHWRKRCRQLVCDLCRIRYPHAVLGDHHSRGLRGVLNSSSSALPPLPLLHRGVCAPLAASCRFSSPRTPQPCHCTALADCITTCILTVRCPRLDGVNTIWSAHAQFAGATLLGRGVAGTIKDGIVDVSYFTDAPEIVMYGMLCALFSGGLWLACATFFELPVSTTHSIIGCARLLSRRG